MARLIIALVFLAIACFIFPPLGIAVLSGLVLLRHFRRAASLFGSMSAKGTKDKNRSKR